MLLILVFVSPLSSSWPLSYHLCYQDLYRASGLCLAASRHNFAIFLADHLVLALPLTAFGSNEAGVML